MTFQAIHILRRLKRKKVSYKLVCKKKVTILIKKPQVHVIKKTRRWRVCKARIEA